MPLFRLLPVIGFVAPPLSKSHVVLARDHVMVRYTKIQSYARVDLVTIDEEAHGVNIP